MKIARILFAGLFLLQVLNLHADVQTVRIWEDKITLPTYATKAPDKNPFFYVPTKYQHAQRHIYPYPYTGHFETEKKDVDYKAVYLENEYVKVCVTPEMGGRIYYAVDKTNDYNIVYYNHVVKPALIGMTGAWTSGGVEWNIPHHHRPTSFLPVDYTITENEDGSKTVWVGEYEKRTRTRWIVGITLEPGKSYVKTEFRYLNVTPVQNTFLFWANTAVHVDDSYQVIFPPDVEKAVYHVKTEFTNWPIANQVYQEIDFTQGQDVSWWKNTTTPTSFFAHESRQDFMAGIDHGKKAGTIKVSDHHYFPGKKFWNWGPNEVGRGWDMKLTDDDGPYLELMMGGYSDNQPDYSFINPMAVKRGAIYYYGLRNMNNIKQANADFAVNLAANLEGKDETVVVQVNATGVHDDIEIIVLDKEKEIFRKTIDIDPATPFSHEFNSNADYENLSIRILSKTNETLLAWKPSSKKNEAHPNVYHEPQAPEKFKNNDDLFLAGLRLEQFGNAHFDPEKYYQEALKRDADDFLVNTQYGTLLFKQGKYEKAENLLRKAASKVTANYTRAKFNEPEYYLGLSLAEQGKIDEACEFLYRSSWSYEWAPAALTVLARLENLRGNFKKAVENADKAVMADPSNVEALLLKSMFSRKQGDKDLALHCTKRVLEIDPLNFNGMYEIYLLAGDVEADRSAAFQKKYLIEKLRGQVDNYLETAARYGEAGFYEDAVAVLKIGFESNDQKFNANPMIDYHLGFYLDLLGKVDEAKNAFSTATKKSTDYCFPYGTTSLKTLKKAVEYLPENAQAYYLMGNILCDNRFEEAIEAWKKAISLDGKVSIYYRNLAFAQANYTEQINLAVENIMQAIRLNQNEQRYFIEADNYVSYARMKPEEIAKFFYETAIHAPETAELQTIDVRLKNYFGKYDESIAILERMQYRTEERAAFNVHIYWFDAHLHRGIEKMKAGKYDEAEKDFLRAMEFPVNLESERDAKVGVAFYFLGLNEKSRGNREKAKEYFEKMIAYSSSEDWGAGYFPEIGFCKGKACLELGRPTEAKKHFETIMARGDDDLKVKTLDPFMTSTTDHPAIFFPSLIDRKKNNDNLADAYYAKGLAHLGLGEAEKAKEMFRLASKHNPSHWGIVAFLKFPQIE